MSPDLQYNSLTATVGSPKIAINMHSLDAMFRIHFLLSGAFNNDRLFQKGNELFLSTTRYAEFD